MIRTTRLRRTVFRAAGAVFLTLGFVAVSAQPASANVPANCGPYSGLPIPFGANLYDFSASPVAIGTPLVPYQVPLVNVPIVIGSPFGDVISGTPLTDILCGAGGTDALEGHAGDDEIYGGDDADTIRGQEGADFLSGGRGNDFIDGDDTVPTGYDLGDTLQGGDDDDDLYGRDGDDILRGGPGGTNVDYGDGGGGGGDTCNGFEQPTVNCP
jgi:Ca2+-binding RTX toxin-like protein